MAPKRPLPPIPQSNVPGADAARRAQRASTARFIEAVEQNDEVLRVSSTLRGMKERNGFGELLAKSMKLR